MAAIALVLCLTSLTGTLSAPLLLALTFANGVGLAMRWPLYAAILPELVPRAQLAAATSLNAIAMNTSRILGPTLAGLVLAAAGSAGVFALNVVIALVIAVGLTRWKRAQAPSTLPSERFFGAIRVGLQHVRQSPHMLALMLRIAAFFLNSMAVLALAPLVALQLESGGAGTYTLLLAAMGAGAIVSRYAGRWNLECTFQESRAHLHSGTTRGWSQRTVLRATPCLLGLYSVVALLYDALPARPEPRAALQRVLRMDPDELERALEKLWIHGGAIVDADENTARGREGWREPYLEQRRHKEAQLEQMRRFAESRGCRMLHLVRHFGDEADSGAACGICDICEKKLVQREDDTEMKVLLRLDKYRSETQAVIPFYEAKGLVKKVDAGRPPDDVYAAIRAALGKR